jgi:hypothetical protein
MSGGHSRGCFTGFLGGVAVGVAVIAAFQPDTDRWPTWAMVVLALLFGVVGLVGGAYGGSAVSCQDQTRSTTESVKEQHPSDHPFDSPDPSS